MLYLNMKVNEKVCMVSSKYVHIHKYICGICKNMGRYLNFIVGYTKRENISKPCLYGYGIVNKVNHMSTSRTLTSIHLHILE